MDKSASNSKNVKHEVEDKAVKAEEGNSNSNSNSSNSGNSSNGNHDKSNDGLLGKKREGSDVE